LDISRKIFNKFLKEYEGERWLYVW
jgi:hypothetical protein